MSKEMLSKLKSVNLLSSLDGLLSKFVIGDSPDIILKIRSAVDEAGLKAPKTMQLIGRFQGDKKFYPYWGINHEGF